MKQRIPLEMAAETVCRQTSIPPLIFQLPPEKGREVLEEAQNLPVYKYPAEISTQCIHTGRWGSVMVYFIKPCKMPVKNIIFYIHGAGWVFGSFHTHEKLVRELCARTDSLVIFPEYTRSPEAKYPVAIEQCYYILSHLEKILEPEFNICTHHTLTVAGDSVGGNMAIAMAFMSIMRCGPEIKKLLLYYPVTNACFNTQSYRCFASGYYLYRAGMEWFWQQYTSCLEERNQITASPLLADIRLLKDLPPTMIINGQADVLRSEGAAFAEKLQCAGVDVTAIQIQGIIHDFVMLNSLDQTNACRIAMDASVAWLNRNTYSQ